MVLKRHFSDWAEDAAMEVPCQESKRRLGFANVVRDVMKGLSLHEFMTKFEPLLRRVVREEVERKVLIYHSSRRSSIDQFDSSQARDWHLHFDDGLPSTFFTGSRIESEDSKPVKIVIIDAISKKIITSGPLSSIKVEIVALDGDFGVGDQEDWTEEEFNANIVREREGKRPLVTGELVITLRGGVGYVNDISFTDNSSWIRSRRFSLGARIVQSISTEARIREARSEAFVVKDHRGELYKKHHPPNFGDEIWRLEKIAKGGAFHRRLADKGITTVEEFLRLYYIDPSLLRNILGGGILNKTWEIIIEHATACVLDNKLYMYYRDAERVGLVFNSVFKLIGAAFDGQNYEPLDKLKVLQKGLVENLKRHAYRNLNDLVPLDEPSVFGPAMLPSGLLVDPFNRPISSLQQVDFSGVHQGQLEMQLDCYHPMQGFSPPSRNNSMATDSCCGPYGGGSSWPPTPLGPLGQIAPLTADNDFQTSTWQGNGWLLSPDFGIINFSRNGKPKARWCMIRAVMKLGVSVRRDVAAKKWQDLFA